MKNLKNKVVIVAFRDGEVKCRVIGTSWGTYTVRPINQAERFNVFGHQIVKIVRK